MKTVGWFSLCEQMKRYDLQVTNAFIQNYKDSVVDLKTLVFILDGAMIAEAIGGPAEGDKWFKQHLFEVNLSQFLLPIFENIDWSKGIHLNRIKPEWINMLKVVQCYITCEGRFATVFRYHLRFVLHINGEQCYRNRTGHQTGEAQNVNRTGIGKKLGKKPAN